MGDSHALCACESFSKNNKKMKLTTRILLILTLNLLVFASASAQEVPQNDRFSIIVIDAGHGGKDPGCHWGDKLEKDLNLKVALALGAKIEEAFPEVKVIYTRKDDTFIELHERGRIANRAGADLFLSIHTDAVGNNKAQGSSTYIMGIDKAEKNLEVAQRENAVVVLEGDYEEKYEGYDPESPESYIIFSLMQYAHAERSMAFAEMIQKHYAKNTPIVNRGAMQGPYLVLWRTAMPAVLTEMGFMTNKHDRDFLHSKAGFDKVVKALFDAVSEYRDMFNAKAGLVVRGDMEAAESVEVAVEATTAVATEEGLPSEDIVADAAEGGYEGPKYYVQICTLSNYSNPQDGKFGPFKGKVEQVKTSSGSWRCIVPAASLEEACELQAQAATSFPGAYVVVLEGDYFRRL